MPRKPDPTLKPAIVGKVTTHLRDTALEDVSVRSLGRVLGTSAYPIVYHFGTRENLIDAVVDRLAAQTDRITLDPSADESALIDYMVTVFGGLDDADNQLGARLAFELGSIESLGERTKHRDMHRRQVDTLTAWATMHGYGDHDAARAAQLAVLAARGIQWGSLIDSAHVDVDAGVRDIAHRLVAGADIPADMGADVC
jgi:AcrR family transcriptional regulator